jgi:hypothetical protein
VQPVQQGLLVPPDQLAQPEKLDLQDLLEPQGPAQLAQVDFKVQLD